MLRTRVLPVLGLALALAACQSLHYPPKSRPATGTPSRAATTVRYNESSRVACHNCYAPNLHDALGAVLHRTRALEIDIFHAGAGSGEWFVSHDKDLLNNSNCEPGDRRRGDLRYCLEVVRDSVLGNPQGEALTVFVDVKDASWLKDGSPAQLDALVHSIFPDYVLYDPRELQGSHSSLSEAADSSQWPSMEHLQGRVVLVLTGPNFLLRQYLEKQGNGAAFFVAPEVRSSAEIDYAKSMEGQAERVVFFNIPVVPTKISASAEHRLDIVRHVRRHNRISRMWNYGDVGKLHIATDLMLRGASCRHVNSGLTFLAQYVYLKSLPSRTSCAKPLWRLFGE